MAPPIRPAGQPGARPADGRRIPWLAATAGLVLGAASAWWFLGREAAPDLSRLANLTAPGETVVFLGDSISRGYGLAEAEAFPGLAAAELGVPHVNAGVSGDTMAAALARLERDVLSHQPRLTVLELGGNDFLQRLPVEQTVRSLDAIVSALVAQGGMVAILHVRVGLGEDPYLEGFREVAARHGALLVPDVLRGIAGDPSLKLDPIHPNARGQRLLAERVAKALRPLLLEAERRRRGVR